MVRCMPLMAAEVNASLSLFVLDDSYTDKLCHVGACVCVCPSCSCFVGSLYVMDYCVLLCVSFATDSTPLLVIMLMSILVNVV